MNIEHIQKAIDQGKVYYEEDIWSVQLQDDKYIFQRLSTWNSNVPVDSYGIKASVGLHSAIVQFLGYCVDDIINDMEALGRHLNRIELQIAKMEKEK